MYASACLLASRAMKQASVSSAVQSDEEAAAQDGIVQWN